MGKWYFLRNLNNRGTVINPAHQIFFGLVEMTFGLVHVSYSLPEWQAVKLTFFAPCIYFTVYVHIKSLSTKNNHFQVFCRITWVSAESKITWQTEQLVPDFSAISSGAVWINQIIKLTALENRGKTAYSIQMAQFGHNVSWFYKLNLKL